MYTHCNLFAHTYIFHWIIFNKSIFLVTRFEHSHWKGQWRLRDLVTSWKGNMPGGSLSQWRETVTPPWIHFVWRHSISIVSMIVNLFEYKRASCFITIVKLGWICFVLRYQGHVQYKLYNLQLRGTSYNSISFCIIKITIYF